MSKEYLMVNCYFNGEEILSKSWLELDPLALL